jgi:hypothetical protein
MFNSVAVGLCLRERVWGLLFEATGELRATTPSDGPADDWGDPLPSTEPRDLGVQADRGGSLGTARGPHHLDV